MKVLLIDDEPLARNITREYLQQYPDFEIMEECNNGFEGIKAIQQYQPDLIFLDIQMPKINGFEMLELIDDPPKVIFTTAFEEYAIKAFEAHAIDYLLKPYSKERFDKAMEKVLQMVNKPALTKAVLETAAQSPMQSNRIVVKDGSRIKIIPLTQVQYLETADDYVKIHTREGIFLKNKTMAYFEKLLQQHQFVRIHRSFMVNVQLISRIEAYEKENHLVLLTTGARLSVSKTGYGRLKALLGI